MIALGIGAYLVVGFLYQYGRAQVRYPFDAKREQLLIAALAAPLWPATLVITFGGRQ